MKNSLSLSSRKPSLRSTFTPGPGAYEAPSSLLVPSSRIGSALRRPLTACSFAPGPGAYELRQKEVEGPKFGFGSSIRRGEDERGKSPGPGSYEAGAGLGGRGKGVTMSSRYFF